METRATNPTILIIPFSTSALSSTQISKFDAASTLILLIIVTGLARLIAFQTVSIEPVLSGRTLIKTLIKIKEILRLALNALIG